MLTITHTSADGTLLEGTVKGDGALDALRAAKYRCQGWRYFPSIRQIGIAQSRDRAPKLHLIDAAADVLREAGFDVEIVVDGTPRAMAEAEAARAEHMEDRADALHAKAERRGAEADARWAAADAISDNIPMGQPVLVGHHSERGHRAALKRMDGHMRKSIEAAAEAKQAAQRAVTAEHHMEARNNPRRVYRRIEKLQADRRKVARELTPCRTSGRRMKPEAEGRRLDCPVCYRDITIGAELVVPEHGAATGRHREQQELNAAHLDEQIGYWTRALEEAKAAGADVPPNPSQIQKGWWIKSWAGWREVVRVNKKTVTVWDSWNGDAGPDDPSRFTRTIPYDNIHEIRDPAGDRVKAAAQDLDAVAPAAPETSPSAPTPARHPSGLSLEAVAVLAAVAATERSVHMAGVPESRDAFAEVDRWLRARPGFTGYDARARCWAYTRDPRQAIAEVTGQLPIAPASAEQDKRLAYFRTPDFLAEHMAAELGSLPRNARVLEPSAGDGALVAAVRWLSATDRGAVYVTAIEADPGRAQLLGRRFGSVELLEVRCQRFQDFAADEPLPFDAVIMNPPFTEPGDRQAWATHFQLAWSLVRPGGRLVAVLPCSYRFHEHGKARAVRALVEGSDGRVVDLDVGTFRVSGTNVRAVLVSVTKKDG